MFAFHTPWKYQKNLSFLMFLGDIKREHWLVMGYVITSKMEI